MISNDQSHDRYALSFTSGGLLVREAALLTSVYLTEHDWIKVRQISIEQNLLQARTTSSSVRVTRETIQRLSVFGEDELQLLSESGPHRALPSHVGGSMPSIRADRRLR